MLCYLVFLCWFWAELVAAAQEAIPEAAEHAGALLLPPPLIWRCEAHHTRPQTWHPRQARPALCLQVQPLLQSLVLVLQHLQ